MDREKQINEVRIQAIKEFSCKAKEKMRDLARVDFHGVAYFLICETFFDNLVKEMVGDTE